VILHTTYGWCGYEFEKGSSYLVYAFSRDGGETLHAEKCTRTNHLGRAELDLNILGQGSPPVEKVSLEHQFPTELEDVLHTAPVFGLILVVLALLLVVSFRYRRGSLYL
jgi:hypothetical protein